MNKKGGGGKERKKETALNRCSFIIGKEEKINISELFERRDHLFAPISVLLYFQERKNILNIILSHPSFSFGTASDL